MPQIFANATVDVLTPSTPKGNGQFKVHVWGKQPYDYTLDYVLTAKTDVVAAQLGIQKFIDDASKLGPKETEQ